MNRVEKHSKHYLAGLFFDSMPFDEFEMIISDLLKRGFTLEIKKGNAENSIPEYSNWMIDVSCNGKPK